MTTEIHIMLTHNQSTPSTTPVNNQWSFATPFENPPAARNIPSIFYTNPGIGQAAQNLSNQIALCNVQRVLQFATAGQNGSPTSSVVPLWLSPQGPLSVRPMLMPFRSPQADSTRRRNLSASDINDTRILLNRYGATITHIVPRSVDLTYSAAVNPPMNRRAAAGTHYHEITISLFEFVRFRDRKPRSLIMYQPTPAGVRQLLKHTLGRDKWPVRVEVIEATCAQGQTIDARINEFLSTTEWWEIVPSLPRIAILMDGQRHAVPLILSKDRENNRHVVVLDSTAGSSVGIYRRLAARHPDLQFWLNEGSRQVDAHSCITDAIEVACQASDSPDIFEQIHARKISASERRHVTNSRLRPQTSHAKEAGQLHRFNLPETLAIGAQSCSFLNNPAMRQDLPIVINGETSTLGQHLHASKDVARRAYFNSEASANQVFRVLNCYLYTASERHARVLDALALAQQ